MTVQPKARDVRKALKDSGISVSCWQRRHECDNVVSLAEIQASGGVQLPRHHRQAILCDGLNTLLQYLLYK